MTKNKQNVELDTRRLRRDTLINVINDMGSYAYRLREREGGEVSVRKLADELLFEPAYIIGFAIGMEMILRNKSVPSELFDLESNNAIVKTLTRLFGNVTDESEFSFQVDSIQ